MTYYADATITLHHGRAQDILPTLAAGSVDCAVTSPPYYGLRDYGDAGQLGAEPTLAQYVSDLVAIMAEVRRVLATDGTCWLNLGDAYSSTTKGSGGTGPLSYMHKQGSAIREGQHFQTRPVDSGGLPDKNLMGVPWRVAMALQDDGWILRNAIIWSKPNAMPESARDRLSGRYELVFLLVQSQRYWFNLDAIREPHDSREAKQGLGPWDPNRPRKLGHGDGQQNGKGAHPTGLGGSLGYNPAGRNPGDVWTISTVPFPGAHFAAFPPEIPRRCILAGCKPGGVVLDPFHGSGTTAMMAEKLGHHYVGIDISQDYLDLSLRHRLSTGALPFQD